MTPLRTEPFATPRERGSRLFLFSLAVLGLVLLLAWDPLAHPGPRCCGLRNAFGLPCPTCGMTRGVSLALHGRFAEATRYNPLTVPCIALFAVLGVKWAYEYVKGRRLVPNIGPRGRLAFWAAVAVIILANWVYLLTYRREDPFASSWLGQVIGWLGG
jgi:hypothetical protein